MDRTRALSRRFLLSFCASYPLRAALPAVDRILQEHPEPAHTFLNSIRHAMREEGSRGERELVYNGKVYLRTVKQSDSGGLTRLNGTVQEKDLDAHSPNPPAALFLAKENA